MEPPHLLGGELTGSTNLSRPYPKLVRVTFASDSTPSASDIFIGLEWKVDALRASLEKIGASGMAAYAAKIEKSLIQGLPVATLSSAKHALSSVDEFYSKLDEVSEDLTVSPKISSLPTGAEIRIATFAQIKENRMEFRRKTDTEAIRLYRGLYEYSIHAPGYKDTMAQLDLVNVPGTSIVCELNTDKTSLFCAAR